VQPRVDLLPLFVRGGSILPVAPLTRSTAEQPAGPLTLRVYVGENCKGTLYQDDGKSYQFKEGKFLRMDSTCMAEQNKVHIRVGPHMGTYPSWWSTISVELYGWQGRNGQAELAGKPVNTKWNSATHCWQATVADSGDGLDITFE